MSLDSSRSALSIADFDPEIITGTEALGRMNELDKVMQFSEMLQMTNSWPETMQRRVKWMQYAGKVSAEIGLEIDWLMSEEEYNEQVAAERQAQMQQQLAAEASKAAPDLVKGGSQ